MDFMRFASLQVHKPHFQLSVFVIFYVFERQKDNDNVVVVSVFAGWPNLIFKKCKLDDVSVVQKYFTLCQFYCILRRKLL